MILRDYQREAVDSLFQYFETKSGNPVLSLPTGSGKSIIQAAFVSETLTRWPDERFLLLSHVKELLAQNAAKLEAMGVKASIYSAGLGSREIGSVTVAGIQSVYKKGTDLGSVSIVMIDECHLLSKNSESMYRKLLSHLHASNPHLKVVGMSATPFRMDSGALHKGKGAIFTDIAYHISIKELIEKGHLCKISSAPVKRSGQISTNGVGKRGGEFIAGELERAANKSDITKAALDEVDRIASHKKSRLVFCVGVDHANAVCEEIRSRGQTAMVVVGDTPPKERDKAIEDFRAGTISSLVSVGVLTTGFDAPNADCLVCLRPTMSPGLWVQMVGRITRNAPGKTDALVLDFTANTATHGPVDLITIDGEGRPETKRSRICAYCFETFDPRLDVCPHCHRAVTKNCGVCFKPVLVSLRVCPECGADFSRPMVAKHETKATSASILSGAGGSHEVDVDWWKWVAHQKEGKPRCLRVEYQCGLMVYSDYVCPEHGGFASDKARQWFKNNGLANIRTVSDALASFSCVQAPKKIRVSREGKYWRVRS
jgi:DNA repair protein RadD